MLRPTGPPPRYQIAERLWAGKAQTLHVLEELQAEGRCDFTVYLGPDSDGPDAATLARAPAGPTTAEVAEVSRQVGPSDTGLVLCWNADRVLAVVPPLPLGRESASAGAEFGELREVFEARPVIGIVLCRLGRYAIGVLQGDRLVASKSDTRYVKSRHRAGGSSQRRFERSRERLVHELFQATCEVAGKVLSPYEGKLDHLMLGGEKHTLRRLVQSCTLLQRLKPITRRRILEAPRPGRKALDNISHEVWRSRIVALTRVDP